MSRRTAYNIVVVVLSMIVLAGFTVGFVSWSIDQNNKKICDVLGTITSAPRQAPGTTATTKAGKDLQEYNRLVGQKMVELQHRYKCPKGKS